VTAGYILVPNAPPRSLRKYSDCRVGYVLKEWMRRTDCGGVERRRVLVVAEFEKIVNSGRGDILAIRRRELENAKVLGGGVGVGQRTTRKGDESGE